MKRRQVLVFGLFSAAVFIFFFITCSTKDKEMPITTSSKEAKQLFIQARDFYENIEFQKATKLLDEAIAKDSNLALAYLYKALAGGSGGDTKTNIEKATLISKNSSAGEKLFIKMNKAITFDNDRKLGYKYSDSLIKMFPEDARVYFYKGWYLTNSGENDSSIIYLKKAIELDQSYAPVHNLLGYAYIRNGDDNDLGEKEFKEYIRLAPKRPNPYDSYAEFLLMQGRYDESIENYNKALQINPEFVTAMVGIGNNYIFKKDYDKAREFYQESYDKSFNIAQKIQALWWKGISYIHAGNIVDATNTFDELSKLAFENNRPAWGISALEFSGSLLAEYGNVNEAEKYLSKAFDFTKSSELSDKERKAFENYIGLDRCYLQIIRKNLEGAEQNLGTLKQLVEYSKEPIQIEYYNLISGILQFNKGNNDLALQYFQKSEKENPYVWYWQAMAQEKAGNIQEAKKIYAKIAGYNVNSLNLALVKDRAKNKM